MLINKDASDVCLHAELLSNDSVEFKIDAIATAEGMCSRKKLSCADDSVSELFSYFEKCYRASIFLHKFLRDVPLRIRL